MALKKLPGSGYKLDVRTVLIAVILTAFLSRGAEQSQLTDLIKKANQGPQAAQQVQIADPVNESRSTAQNQNGSDPKVLAQNP